MARATIADVAKLAGVSQATVSRALRGVDKVAPATRRKVEEAADRLSFTLLKSASALASGKTMRIILLCSGGLNEWFNANVLQGVYEVLSPEGYDICPSFIRGRDEMNRYFVQLPKDRNADAIIIASFQLDETQREQLRSIDMPVIGVNIPAESSCDASVCIDNFSGMAKGVCLLKSLGHEHIAFAGDYIPGNMVYSASQRVEGFLEAAERNGYGEDDASIVMCSEHSASYGKPQLAAELVAKMLSSPNRPTAVCAETDQMAIALIKELKRQHLRVPDDISVIGFDDADVAEVADLTTIRQDPLELGRVAAYKTLQLLKGESPDEPHESQEPMLVLRDTTSRVPLPEA
jgi:LacI family repressor for deo operon, udp, cdd, tsx, nupC, and nupG